MAATVRSVQRVAARWGLRPGSWAAGGHAAVVEGAGDARGAGSAEALREDPSDVRGCGSMDGGEAAGSGRRSLGSPGPRVEVMLTCVQTMVMQRSRSRL